jgi:hypothetical protein
MRGIDQQELVLAYFRAEAGRFGLDAGSLTARRVLNWGGFVSHSYHVGDSRSSVHAKLATDHDGLRRWLAVHDVLEGAYHAPPVLAWLDLPGTPYGGLVFEHIGGDTWDTGSQPALLNDLRDLLRRLRRTRITTAWPTPGRSLTDLIRPLPGTAPGRRRTATPMSRTTSMNWPATRCRDRHTAPGSEIDAMCHLIRAEVDGASYLAFVGHSGVIERYAFTGRS